MPVKDYEQLLAHAVIGEEVCRIIRESGLMVPRQKPGRKAEVPVNAKAVKSTPAPVEDEE